MLFNRISSIQLLYGYVCHCKFAVACMNKISLKQTSFFESPAPSTTTLRQKVISLSICLPVCMDVCMYVHISLVLACLTNKTYM